MMDLRLRRARPRLPRLATGVRRWTALALAAALLWPAAASEEVACAAEPAKPLDAGADESPPTACLQGPDDAAQQARAGAGSERAPVLARGDLHRVDRRPDGGDVDEDVEPEPDPDNWEDFSHWDLNRYFGCDAIFAGPLVLYDAAAWERLRHFYHSFVFHDERENPYYDGEPDRTYQISDEAFAQPTTPFHTGGKKGRGLRAARDLRAGELVFQATNNTIVFADGATWRAFLFAIHDNYDDADAAQAACDLLVWSWVQDVGDSPVIVVDLDNGSLLNQGREGPGWDPPNVRCGRGDGDECGMSYYTTRDVKEGEELLADYREFANRSWDRVQL